MDWQELKKAAYQLSVYDRLLLLESIAHSLTQELRPRPPLSEDVVERLFGAWKPEGPPLTDEDIDRLKEERLMEKYLSQ